MKTVGKKLLSLLLVVVMVMSVIPFAAFADGCDHTRTEHAATDANCTEAGTIACWYCATCDKYFDAETGGNELTSIDDDAKPVLNHDKVHVDAVPANCADGTSGTTAYWRCTRCEKNFKDDGTIITGPETIAAVHKDVDPVNGECDACGKTIKCTITFVVKKDGNVIDGFPKTMVVDQGAVMGYPTVDAPNPPSGYAYDRTNNSVWKLVERNGVAVTTTEFYNTQNVVTVGTETMKYEAVQLPQVMNLTVAFRKDGAEHIFFTRTLPYSETVDGGKGIPVYRYLWGHDMNGTPVSEGNSIWKAFENAFNNKNITTNTGAKVDVSGYSWDGKFLSSATGNSIDSLALKLDINYGAVSSDIKVYAQLKAQTSFEITFSPMSPYGTAAGVQGTFGKRTVSLNSVLSNLPTPTCNGYVFMGWYDEPMKGDMTYANGLVTLDVQNNGAKHYVNGTQYTTRGNVTLYPYWIKEVDAWVVVHNNPDGNISSMAKIQGVRPTDSIAKSTVLSHVQGYTAGNYKGPYVTIGDSAFDGWNSNDKLMGATQVTAAGQSYYFHVYSPTAVAKTVTPSGNSGANGTSSGGSSNSSTVDPSNPKTGDLARNNLNVACAALAVSVIAMGAVVCTFPKKKEI